jgi:hypothetical protein
VDLLDVPRHRLTHLLGAHLFRRRHQDVRSSIWNA